MYEVRAALIHGAWRQLMGHPVDKLEVLVLGGTWESYPKAYREEFIRDLFWASNVFFDKVRSGAARQSRAAASPHHRITHHPSPSYAQEPKREKLSLAEEQHINESAKCKVRRQHYPAHPDSLTYPLQIIGLTLETRPDTVNSESIRLFRQYGYDHRR